MIWKSSTNVRVRCYESNSEPFFLFQIPEWKYIAWIALRMSCSLIRSSQTR